MPFEVYEIKNTESGKSYFGVSEDANNRMNQHLDGRGNKGIQADVKEHGIDVFEKSVIKVCQTFERAKDIETKKLLKHDKELLYNGKIPKEE